MSIQFPATVASMMIKRLLILCLLVSFPSGLAAQGPSSDAIDKAIAALRNIPRKGLSDEKTEAMAKQIDEAWKTLIDAKASERLKREIAKVDAGKETDDFFKLGATVLLWNIGKAGEAEYVASVWNTTPIANQYNYVFYTAFEAAQTQDPKVLPMLKAFLRDDKGFLFVSAHAMRVAWPLSIEFVWGTYGAQGLPVLAEVLVNSKEDVEIGSALTLLSKAQYLPSLPRIRQLAESKNDPVRRLAVQSLGRFGHPDDYERLATGITDSVDPSDIFSYAFALYEYDDERAVPHLIPMLTKGNEGSQVEVALALLNLLTPESLAAVKTFVTSVKNTEVKQFLQRSITRRLAKLPSAYERLPRTEQAQLMANVRNEIQFGSESNKSFTNAQLIEALKQWKKNGRVYQGEGIQLPGEAKPIASGIEWPGEAKMIAAAKPENIDQMLDTKASFYRRLSDECLYETRDMDTVIKYVGRSRYRQGVGVTAKAEPK